jgi:hypothetical protein
MLIRAQIERAFEAMNPISLAKHVTQDTDLR